jgi:anti-sigma-K factor RskA
MAAMAIRRSKWRVLLATAAVAVAVAAAAAGAVAGHASAPAVHAVADNGVINSD